MTLHPSVLIAENVGAMLKASAVMRPESLVSLSDTTMTNGLSLPLAANPGIAANASLASPSIEAPSETVQIVTRSFFRSRSAIARPCACGRAEPSGPLLKSTPRGLRCDSPWPVSLLWMLRKAFKSANVIPS